MQLFIKNKNKKIYKKKLKNKNKKDSIITRNGYKTMINVQLKIKIKCRNVRMIFKLRFKVLVIIFQHIDLPGR